MARKITNAAIEAFMSGRPFNRDNTSVEKQGHNLVLCLHGNVIARREEFQSMGIAAKLCITNAGWNSNTTKERLNGLPSVSVVQCKGVWFLNGKEWDGSWIEVNR
jgi:hypothetical protein